MHRTSGKNVVRFENLEETLAKSSQMYGHIDLLCAGWPCQGNSIAGKREGLQSETSGLWKELARCLRLFKPRWFIGENVPGFLSVNEGKDFHAVISELQEIGYGISWRILDSQYFGLAQRRKRLFFVGYFGEICPPEILFEQESSFGNDTPKQTVQPRRLCLSTKSGERQDPTAETYIASTIGTNDNYRGNARTKRNYVAFTIGTTDFTGQTGTRSRNIVAQTLGASKRGNASFVWQDTHIAETNPERKREIAGIPSKLNTCRGIVIGNAVSVPVAEWIGKRIMAYERGNQWREFDI